MKKFKFNLHALEEMYSYGLVDQVDSIFEFMHHEIKNGNSILFEKNHNPNENSNTIFFHDSCELNQFYNEFAKKNCPPLDVLFEHRNKANVNFI